MAVLCGAFFLAYMPAINIQLGDFFLDQALSQITFVVLVQFSAIFLVGAYSIIWRYISIQDLKVFLQAAFISGSILLALRFLLTLTSFRQWQVPISVILIDTVLAFGGLVTIRVVRRFFYELGEKRRFFSPRPKLKRRPTLIVGAGRKGASLAKEMLGRADAELNIRGFVDNDKGKWGGRVSSIKVLGATADLPRLVKELNVEQIVIAIDDPQGKEIRDLLDICSAISVKAQIVPSLNEIAHGHVSINRVRNVQIEDLLGREPVTLDDKNLGDFLGGRTVMVTGAGGSIGSELARQIAVYQPKKLLLVERAEFLLFQIAHELGSDAHFIPLLADVGDEPRMREIFEEYRPEIIFHAAAHKHVPLIETNAGEAIKNNVFTTRLVATLAGEYGTTDFVLISTDKAVNPTSIMGASKRVAEIVVQTLDQLYPTNYVAVRFGNVLGSTGSVVPIFRDQIRNGEAVTVTHPDMTRYFMTIPEATQLVMQAGALGESGEIFVLDMGRPVKILDLAKDMIRLSGLTPYEDVDIVFTGVRKGEKLFEEFEITGENLLRTRHPKIFIGKIATYPPDQVGRILSELREALNHRDRDMMLRAFGQFLPEAQFEQPPSDGIQGNANNDRYFSAGANFSLAEK